MVKVWFSLSGVCFITAVFFYVLGRQKPPLPVLSISSVSAVSPAKEPVIRAKKEVRPPVIKTTPPPVVALVNSPPVEKVSIEPTVKSQETVPVQVANAGEVSSAFARAGLYRRADEREKRCWQDLVPQLKVDLSFTPTVLNTNFENVYKVAARITFDDKPMNFAFATIQYLQPDGKEFAYGFGWAGTDGKVSDVLKLNKNINSLRTRIIVRVFDYPFEYFSTNALPH